MKIKTLPQAWIIAVVSVLLIQAGFAQAPSGSIASPIFSGVGKGLYDLTGVLTNLSVDFAASDGGAVPWSQDVRVVQSITGTVTASTTGTVVTIIAQDGSFSCSAAYTLKGTVKSSGSNILLSTTFTCKSTAFLGGDPTYETIKFTESFTSLATINPVAGIVTGRQTGTAVGRLGSKVRTMKLLDPTFSGPIPSGYVPIDWHLDMTLDSIGAKVTGSASVSLENGRSFPFTVKGTYTARTGVSKLALTGTGAGKGTKLTVAMNGNSLTGITGSLLGQKVALSGL